MFAALQLPSCQFPNYNLLPADGQGGSDGGASSAGSSGNSSVAGGAGAGGSSQPPLCEEGLSCQPTAPAGWLGPVAYWQGPSGEELPDCPDGYSDPTDLHGDPEGAPADCPCTCTARDLTCDQSPVKIYNDLDCVNACATFGAQECSAAAVSGCSGAKVSIDAPRKGPSGNCTADVDPQLTSASWRRDARFCELATEVEECGAEQSCFPTPSGGFASQLCVYRVVLAGQDAPECPESYPNLDLLYTRFEDERGCGECECEGPTGGRCDGEVVIATNNDCSIFEKYAIGAACLEINTPSYISVDYTIAVRATCAVAVEPEPIGEVLPSGNYHAVCCQ